MQKTIWVLSASLWLAGGIKAQNMGIDAILQQIEKNNKELQATVQLNTAQKLENRSNNNLADPTLSYAHLWDSKDAKQTVGEMVVSQSFDFPTLYVSRSKMNRAKGYALDARTHAMRQQILLQAQELCIDIVQLNRLQTLLEDRLTNAEELSAAYHKKLNKGEANSLEMNKINLELLNVRTETRTNKTLLQSKLKELRALNGNQPLYEGEQQEDEVTTMPALLGLTEYAAVPLPTDFAPLCDELTAADADLQAWTHESNAAHRQVTVNKQGWLPKLEMGYRRNTESGHPLNGIVVGVSFPIFENRGKVKSAKAQAMSSDYLKENAMLQTQAMLWQLYDEACGLHASMEEYKQAFSQQQDLSLLKQALDGGQINLIEYFVEVAVIYQSQANLLSLENQYQKVMARIYKSKL